jgi:hypothetical protein
MYKSLMSLLFVGTLLFIYLFGFFTVSPWGVLPTGKKMFFRGFLSMFVAISIDNTIDLISFSISGKGIDLYVSLILYTTSIVVFYYKFSDQYLSRVLEKGGMSYYN